MTVSIGYFLAKRGVTILVEKFRHRKAPEFITFSMDYSQYNGKDAVKLVNYIYDNFPVMGNNQIGTSSFKLIDSSNSKKTPYRGIDELNYPISYGNTAAPQEKGSLSKILVDAGLINKNDAVSTSFRVQPSDEAIFSFEYSGASFVVRITKGEKMDNYFEKYLLLDVKKKDLETFLKFLKEYESKKAIDEESNGRLLKLIDIIDYNSFEKDFLVKRRISKREINTLFLKESFKLDILNDLERFFAASKKYKRLGISYKRNYLFSGIQGTGKTSLAQVIAGIYSMSLYKLSLYSFEKASELRTILSEIPANTLILIEEVDKLYDNHKDDNSDKNPIPYEEFLSFLDGVNTPEGCIIIMTTNHYDKLDQTLLRRGRIDRVFEFTYIDPISAKMMFEMYFEGADNLDVLSEKFSYAFKSSGKKYAPTDLQNLFLQYEDSPELVIPLL